MSLDYGRHMLAIPGPSVVPDRVLQAMHQPAPDIYGGRMEDITLQVIDDLKTLACTKQNVALYIANGHGVWEAAIVNVIAPGDKILSLASGRFGTGWAGAARDLGAQTQMLNWGPRRGMDLNDVRQALEVDKNHEIKAITCTQVDTSSSFKYDIKALRDVMDAAGHPALLMVDCVASLGCDHFEMDKWGVDVMLAASQKGLMTPPGTGFVFFSDKANEARQKLENVSPYWDWVPRSNPEIYYQRFFGTAPTHHLFGLHQALEIILREEGLEHVWQRHKTHASAIWAAFEIWSQEGVVSLNVENPDERSSAVTCARIDGQKGTLIRKWLSDNFGLTLGVGMGMTEPGDPELDSYFRIGHMGHLNPHMLLGTLSSIETAFTAHNIPHGSGGVQAAGKICADCAGGLS